MHKYGADLNHIVPQNLHTPIFDAIESQNIELIKYLIENHADLSHRDIENNSALDFARLLGHDELVTLLEAAEKKLEAKPEKPKESTASGATPMIFSGPKSESLTTLSSDKSKPKI